MNYTAHSFMNTTDVLRYLPIKQPNVGRKKKIGSGRSREKKIGSGLKINVFAIFWRGLIF